MENGTEKSSAAEQDILADPLIGMIVDGRYQVEKLLARGGMATVFLAQDIRLDRPVAFKIMHPHLAESEEFVNRFRREARAAAKILHPAVVSVFDQGVVAGSGYLVMEYVPGITLRGLLQKQGALSVRKALDYCEAILQALNVAHSVGIIHRDIKPENVLVLPDESIKVTDFGLARAISDVSSASTGSVMGTVAYLAPEIVSEVNPDFRCDLYSLGIMLFEMLTGTTPFAERTAIQVALAHVSEDIPAPSSLESWLPPEVDELVCALAARQVSERPESAQAALEMLQRVRREMPPSILERYAEVVPVDMEASTQTIRERGDTLALPRDEFTDTAALGAVTSAKQVSSGSWVSIPHFSRTNSDSEDVAETSGSDRPVFAGPTQKPKRRGLRIAIWSVLAIIFLTASGLGGTWWWYEYGPGSYREVAALENVAYQEAVSQLELLELKFEVVEEFSDTVATGVVIRTEPGTPGKVHKRSVVKLVVSKGVQMVVVPDVTTKPLEEAKTELTAGLLKVGAVSEDYSEEHPEGTVISLSPAPAETVPHHSEVSIVVSKGRKPIEVPDFNGFNRSDAEVKLTELGLIYQVTEEFNDTVAAGGVISQSVAAGETLYKGDSVSLVISKGPENREVPNVVGKNYEEAKSILENAGFKVETRRIFLTFGLVADQTPAGGSVVKVGSTVTLSLV
ncbi:Stk1 family PASTA domain-containing Ser/Thr kinase [Gleimia sp. 6138-11-ORH1]|uniref:Stk1 family PASTA domain-containing Ser/Thr kinase n=1 Tax=Gleimia sp. 6138-11-ORH1 TaxID=2973937 RepID=UPI0021695E54|nr:Stk1 family PASTA domain-containing Ser/Thr kinase [Gleimia sp. 6138-11-ORH1]MCS4484446.1 Stk1 family PASTA domain-containing Ser/Thr kinase [Gleimia sp. 6138-11-ORH1]